jgi:hypothetical protein
VREIADSRQLPLHYPIDSDKGFAMIPHDSPSLFEALPGLSG